MLWTEVKEAIALLKRSGIAKHGITNSATGPGQTPNILHWLHVLSSQLVEQSAIAMKDTYATTLGKDSTVRILVGRPISPCIQC
jgi:hypothetical protein